MIQILAISLSFLDAMASPAKTLPVTTSAPNLLMEISGRIYPKDQFPEKCKAILQGVKCEADAFGRYRLEAKKDGDQIVNFVTFSGPEGDQVIERSWEKNGKVIKAIIENRAIKKRSQLEIKNGKAHYEVTDLEDYSVKTSVDDAEDNLVVPSTLLNYVKMHSEPIAKGETVQIKMAVLDRRDSFTFNIHKIKDDVSVAGEPIQILEMTPASLIVRAAVDPMYFYVKTKTNEMYAYEGESGLRRKVGDTYEKMKVRTSYEYRHYGEVAGDTKTVKTDGCNPHPVFNQQNSMKCEVKQ